MFETLIILNIFLILSVPLYFGINLILIIQNYELIEETKKSDYK